MVSMYSLRVYSEATRQALSTVALAVAFSTRVIQLPHVHSTSSACMLLSRTYDLLCRTYDINYLVRTTYYVVRTT